MARHHNIWRPLSIATVATATLLSGCLGFGGTKSSATNPAQKVTLTMWGLFDDPAVWQPIITSYQQANPNVTINYVKKDFATYEQDSFDALAARTGPDIWLIRNDWMPRDYEKLTPAPDALFATKSTSSVLTYQSKVPSVAYNDSVITGKIYGVPLSVDSLVLYYNKTLYSAERGVLNRSSDPAISSSTDLQQPPNSWQDVIRYDGLLQQKDGNGDITRAGIALGANNVDQSQDILSALMLQTGTQMVAADRKSAAFNLSQTISTGKVTVPGADALTFFRSFSDSKNANYTWPTNFPNSIQAFEQGKVAMMINYGYVQNQLKQDVPNLNFGISALPQIAGSTTATDYSSYWLETVTKASAHSDIAWDFLKSALQQAGGYAGAAGRPDSVRPADTSGPATVSDRATTGTPLTFEKLTDQDWYKGRRANEVDGIFRDLIQAVNDGDGAQHALDSAATKVTSYLSNQTPSPAPDAKTQ